MLPEELFIQAIDTTLRDQILAGRQHNHVILDALEALKSDGTLPMKSALTDWRTDDGLVFYKD